MSLDGDAHEGRRNAVIAVAVTAISLAVVGAMFWLMSSLSTPGLAPIAALAAPTAAPSASAPTDPTAEPTQTSVSVPPIGTWTPTTTFRLPPPEQPTFTVPVPGQTADPVPGSTTAPGSPGSASQAPVVNNLKLTCSKGDGRAVSAKLTFSTSTPVDAVLFAGGAVQRQQGGPGDVVMTASGRGPKVCIAKVGDQTLGPIPAA